MDLLTEDQLERAARFYCELTGQNADENIGHGASPTSDGAVSSVLLYSPRWQLVAQELRQLDLMQMAVEYVRG